MESSSVDLGRVVRGLWRRTGAVALVVCSLIGLAGCSGPPTTALFGWATMAPASMQRFEAIGVAVNGKLYVFGGFTNNFLSATTKSEVYDPASDTWAPLADLPAQITHARPVVDGNTIWLLGGSIGGFAGALSSDVWRYDIGRNEWTAGPSLPGPRSGGGAAIVDSVLHYFGGWDSSGDLDEHWTYDLSDPVGWQAAPPLPVARNHIGSATLDGLVYAIGGQFGNNEENGNSAEVERFDPATNMWSQVADLPAGRGHTTSSCFVRDGRIIVAGGDVNGLKGTSSIVTYDPSANVWAKLPDLPAGRETPVTDVIGDAIISSTGNSGTGATTTTWSGQLGDRWEVAEPMPAMLGEVATAFIGKSLFVVGEGDDATFAYDIGTGAWTTRASRPYAGNHHAAEVYGGELYILGGLGAGQGKVQIYNPATDEWRVGADMPFAAGSSSSAVIGDAIYVAGGIVGNVTTSQVARYDPALDQWTTVASMPVGRNHAASGTDGSRLYVFGGRGLGNGDGNGVANGFDTVQIYDPTSDTWQSSTDPGSTLSPLPQARGGMGKAVFHDGRFYVMGGETLTGAGATADHVYRRVDVYNVAANQWTQATPMPTARHGIFPASIAGRVYVAGGGIRASGSSSALLEVYNLG